VVSAIHGLTIARMPPNRELLLRRLPEGLVADQTASHTTLDKLASVPDSPVVIGGLAAHSLVNLKPAPAEFRVR
jgi:hypothetical protein